MELVGYARVSTREERQVFDRQVDALRAAGCERIYDDRGSGASTDRPGLKACTGGGAKYQAHGRQPPGELDLNKRVTHA